MMEHDHHGMHAEPLETRREYLKFAGVLAGILLVSLLLSYSRGWGVGRFMNDFMAVFFVTFAAFKFVNIEMFAAAYRGYDVIARRFTAWAYAFPFIEAGLGFAYLLSNSNPPLNLITMVITGVAGVGVLQELRKKSAIPCACLGTVIRLPLSKISFVEDFLMFIMAAFMFLFL
jgi:hypothetical protein